jgi:hypothetical protein
MRNRVELASTACFIAFALVAFTVSVVMALPLFVAGVLLTLRARALRP